jgi:hypothetical protein
MDDGLSCQVIQDLGVRIVVDLGIVDQARDYAVFQPICRLVFFFARYYRGLLSP